MVSKSSFDRHHRILLIGFLCLVCVNGYWLGISSGSGNKHSAGDRKLVPLEIESKDLDLGDVWAQEEFRSKLRISNNSDRAIEIVDLRSSCECTTVAPRLLRIRPHESAEIDVTLNLTTFVPPSEPGKVFRNFSATLLPIVDGDYLQHKGWKITGRVHDAIIDLPSVVHLGDYLAAADEPPTTRIQVTTPPDIKRIEAEFDASQLGVEILSVPDEAGKFDIVFSLAETLSIGGHRIPVMLTPRTSSGEKLPSRRVYVVGEVVHDVQAVPASVAFGAIYIGERVEQQIVLRSRRGEPFDVKVDSSLPTSITLVRHENNSNVEQIFQVIQNAIAQGTNQGMLRFRVRGKLDKKPRLIAVPVSYHGLHYSK